MTEQARLYARPGNFQSDQSLRFIFLYTLRGLASNGQPAPDQAERKSVRRSCRSVCLSCCVEHVCYG